MPKVSYAEGYAERSLSSLERRINGLYVHAQDESMKRSDKFWKTLEQKVSVQHEAVDLGIMSTEDWHTWVNKNIMRGKQLDAIVSDIAQRLADSTEIASSYINDITPKVFKETVNFEEFTLENDYGAGYSFSLIDDNVLKELMTGNHVEFDAQWKRTFTDPREVYAWSYTKVQDSIHQGLLLGESIPKIANRIQQVTGSTRATAIRNARTAIGSAREAGKQYAFEQAAQMGIEIVKEWKSIADGRSRDSHAELKGVSVPYDKPFPNGLMYPKDPKGKPAEIYNCRCTMGRVRDGSLKKTDNSSETYEEWLKNKYEEYTRRRVAEDGHEIIDKATYSKLTKKFLKNGGIIVRGTEAERHLKSVNASASYMSGANAAYIKDDATVSDVLEEMFHAEQDQKNRFIDDIDLMHIRREIEAQEYLIRNAEKYKIPEEETLITKENLKRYKQRLEDKLNE